MRVITTRRASRNSETGKGDEKEGWSQDSVPRMQSFVVGKLTKGNRRFDNEVIGVLSKLYYKVNRLR